LRLGIGWHFFREGADKIPDPSWTAAHFFTGSKGPLKPLFESMVWDVDGRARLNYSPGSDEDGWPEIDLEQTLSRWDEYQARVADQYGFDEAQRAEAAACLQRWEDQLTWYFDEHREEILQYFQGLDRRDRNRGDAARQGVTSLRGQAEVIEYELAAARGPWLAEIDRMWAGYAAALEAVATPEQRLRRASVTLPRPGRRTLDLDTVLIDRIVPWFDLIVGALLIVGLFTRLAALAGAGFLFSIILTQWPGAPGALPVHYQAIEMLGLLVLAAVGAGQFAGLDYVLYNGWLRSKKSKQETHS
jgi:uncharacterized membrane protein YphA (DoxX/SURF4 family)